MENKKALEGAFRRFLYRADVRRGMFGPYRDVMIKRQLSLPVENVLSEWYYYLLLARRSSPTATRG